MNAIYKKPKPAREFQEALQHLQRGRMGKGVVFTTTLIAG